MKLSESVQPIEINITEVKGAYNRVLKRMQEAQRYIDNPDVPAAEREKHLPAFKIEIVDVLEAYLKLLESWDIEVSPEEIVNGFNV